MINLRRKVTELLDDNVRRHSSFLILTSLSNAVTGLVFWTVAARLYSTEDVGMATTLFSNLSLLLMIAQFGIPQSIIRYLPEKDTDDLVTTSMIICGSTSAVFGLIFIVISKPLLKSDILVGISGVFFILFLISDMYETVLGKCFMTLRKTEKYLIQNLILATRILFLPIFLIYGGAMGVFSSIGASFVISNAYSWYSLKREGLRRGDFRSDLVRELRDFSLGNYSIGLFLTVPNHVMPLVILRSLGPESAAFFYMANKIASLLYTVPIAFSSSVFIEGSHGKEIRTISKQAIISSIGLILPALIIISIFAKNILGIFGDEYTTASTLLIYLSISSIFITVFRIYVSIERIRENISRLVIFSFAISVGVIGIAGLGLPRLGIQAVGLAYILTYGIASLIVSFIILR